MLSSFSAKSEMVKPLLYADENSSSLSEYDFNLIKIFQGSESAPGRFPIRRAYSNGTNLFSDEYNIFDTVFRVFKFSACFSR